MIIGLAGYAGAGKNEAAKGLEPLGFKQIAFADKLREFLYTLNPIVEDERWATHAPLQDVIDTYGWQGVKDTDYGPEVRRLLQVLGTDCGRNLLSDNVWVDPTLDQVGTENVVISDVRFPNEAQAIKDRGGFIVRIKREGLGPLNVHSSETAMDSWPEDYTLLNDGDVAELQITIREIAWNILSQPKVEFSDTE